MTDYADMIDRALERETRRKLVDFLQSYQHCEFGRRRSLDHDEIALVMTIIDRFIAHDSMTQLGVAEFDGLTGKLAFLATLDDHAFPEHGVLIRNSCFNAVASIKALEARLRLCSLRRPWAGLNPREGTSAANDAS